jgi:hypothetical protein
MTKNLFVDSIFAAGFTIGNPALRLRQGNRLVGVDESGRLTGRLRSFVFSARRTFDGTGSRRELVGLFGASS